MGRRELKVVLLAIELAIGAAGSIATYQLQETFASSILAAAGEGAT